MAPALGLGLGLPEKKQKISLPVLLIGVQNDRVVPNKTNVLKYHSQLPDSELMMLEGKAGHYVFLNEGNTELQKEAKKYYRDNNNVNRGFIHDQLTAEIFKYLTKHLE